ncbi:hypothetical protein [Aminobacter sp. MDW-2]|uniref:hypothetical protein n=1 Tax=Aminobacter sp. MDW-2 TaxID=2666139 RepID=UPI0012AFCCF4|nr:hypothetical protein [Aminobacter sp. MDW-2]MRX31871.1 hypothetical protein [Aminobacter sp. MDW-2]QNH32347.1 hypothetical protein H5P29_17490 [Aminobacter sp. MDW-2]
MAVLNDCVCQHVGYCDGSCQHPEPLAARLSAAYEKVAAWPENRMTPNAVEELGEGFTDLLKLRNIVPDVLTYLSTTSAGVTEEQTAAKAIFESLYADRLKHGEVTPWDEMYDLDPFKASFVTAARAALEASRSPVSQKEAVDELCSDCPPIGYPTNKTRCVPCLRRSPAPAGQAAAWQQYINGRWCNLPEDWSAEECARMPEGKIFRPLYASPAPAVEPVGIKALHVLFQNMQSACANYLEPTTYIRRFPSEQMKFATEFKQPDPLHSDTQKSIMVERRNVAFILDIIRMLDGPEQRAAEAALHPTPTPAGIGRIQSSLHPSFSRSGIEPCGGCGQSDPSKRCLGCLHSFPFTPTQVSAPVGVVELHIVFQDDGGAANLRFVEVETLDRKSVCAGTWLKRDDGYDVLALSVHPSDIKTVEAK